jgi:predicted ATP-grasp superfamily ATP-dependent carboligase
LIISAAGIVGNEPTLTNHKEQVVTIVSTKSAEKLIQGYFFVSKRWLGSEILASLLNEGAFRGLDVILLFVSTTTKADFHAAALVSKSISRLFPGVRCDISSLMGEAEELKTRSRKSQNYLSSYE